jgi:hypothetical protein
MTEQFAVVIAIMPAWVNLAEVSGLKFWPG